MNKRAPEEDRLVMHLFAKAAAENIPTHRLSRLLCEVVGHIGAHEGPDGVDLAKFRALADKTLVMGYQNGREAIEKRVS